VKGKSGKRNDLPWQDALRIELARANEAGKKPMLHMVAEACINKALEGDMQAIKEIGDRLDGKPHQSQTLETTIRQFVIEAKAERPTAQIWETQHKPKNEKTIQ
jgi:hypothetical protein